MNEDTRDMVLQSPQTHNLHLWTAVEQRGVPTLPPTDLQPTTALCSLGQSFSSTSESMSLQVSWVAQIWNMECEQLDHGIWGNAAVWWFSLCLNNQKLIESHHHKRKKMNEIKWMN